MTDIFVSHAVADRVFAEKFVTFLTEAIGVPSSSIFCSSLDGQGVPLGHDFNEYMKNQIQEPQLVILLMTSSYMESSFCLMELGATWAKSLDALPIVIPPVTFNSISSTLGLKQGWSITDHAKLIDLRNMIRSLDITLENRTEHVWDKKRNTWREDLPTLIRGISPASHVAAHEHKFLQERFEATSQELTYFKKAHAAATDTITKLKAAKDSAEVKAIMAQTTDFDAEKRFEEIIDTISDLRPNVSLDFYRNMIMDLYDKASSIDWSDIDQKSSIENAIKYNLIEKDPPYDIFWHKPKLKSIKTAVNNLQDFLESNEASDFVTERESGGHIMDLEDLAFWDEYLK